MRPSAIAANGTSLPSPTNNSQNGTNISQNSVRMNCDFHHEQNCFLDYFGDPVPDDVVIYATDVPFQYNNRGQVNMVCR